MYTEQLKICLKIRRKNKKEGMKMARLDTTLDNIKIREDFQQAWKNSGMSLVFIAKQLNFNHTTLKMWKVGMTNFNKPADRDKIAKFNKKFKEPISLID